MPGKSPSGPKHTMLTVSAPEATAKDISQEKMSLLPYFFDHSLDPIPHQRSSSENCLLTKVPRSKSVNMSNPTKQNLGGARDQHAWSTTATYGSGDQTRSDVRDTNATEIIRSSSGTHTPFAIQRWLAEKPHEGPWNGMVVSRRPGEQADKRN